MKTVSPTFFFQFKSMKNINSIGQRDMTNSLKTHLKICFLKWEQEQHFGGILDIYAEWIFSPAGTNYFKKSRKVYRIIIKEFLHCRGVL